MAAQTVPLEQLRSRYRSSLQEFSAGSGYFQLLDTVSSGKGSNSQPENLYVLDSSFNPPTIAHAQMVTSALRAAHTKGSTPSRLLLLLAIQNADKQPKPALFEDRLVMMRLAAEDLQESISKDIAQDDGLAIDIGVTKRPYFVDKAVAIATGNGGVYPQEVEQVHLTGYDTLVRIFEPRYYPAENLGVLDAFFNLHRLRVMLRPDASWGDRDEQQAFLANLAKGAAEKLGAKREWADRIELVESNDVDREPVSSTTARDASQEDLNLLSKLVTPRIYQYIVDHELYTDGR
ncbi:uncharacterized protein GIQ15_01391 [Arthroderma uncinatum]|uniref:uncharacterized protein n=1 Tax=Arthroderma uncinatum TaxID=74035 RepID=UPI00144A72C5|nr:uncharacterized protein GIQ15_01391 [Arthroderma uncinatum]KAF3491874.1 hypothetical protein GIQ15_01391 [Arthroderma uncinatum]